MNRSRALGLSAGALILAASSLIAGPANAANVMAATLDDDPWAVLMDMRGALSGAGPSTVDFVQTFLPVGFTQGEKESGVLALSLPSCLRWDYSEPYPKSFLLCDDRYYHWNPEDRTGIKGMVEREDEPGLDLLLVEIEDLKTRYRAGLVQADGSAEVEVRLTPLEPMTQLREATLRVDKASRRLLALEYTNQEGSWTSFELGEPESLVATDLFLVPPGIAWEEE